jgi:hypothetical protein
MRSTESGRAHFKEGGNEHSHVCLFRNDDGSWCNTPLTLPRYKKPNGHLGTYSTSPAVDHLKLKHPTHAVAVAALGRQQKKQTTISVGMRAGSATTRMSSVAPALTQSTLLCSRRPPGRRR